MAETRLRRGKEVAIPKEWQCRVPTHGTYKDRKDARVMVRANRKQRLRVERDFSFDSQISE